MEIQNTHELTTAQKFGLGAGAVAIITAATAAIYSYFHQDQVSKITSSAKKGAEDLKGKAVSKFDSLKSKASKLIDETKAKFTKTAKAETTELETEE